jgi:hypothetical protein
MQFSEAVDNGARRLRCGAHNVLGSWMTKDTRMRPCRGVTACGEGGAAISRHEAAGSWPKERTLIVLIIVEAALSDLPPQPHVCHAAVRSTF